MKTLANLVLLFLSLGALVAEASESQSNAPTAMRAFPPDSIRADTNQWGPITCDVQMFVRLEQNKTEITTNEAFGVGVYLRNVSSNQTHYVRDGMPDNDSLRSFSCTIKSPSGKEIASRKINEPVFLNRLVKLSPMQTVKLEYPLGALWQMDEAGTYTIILKKRFAPVVSDCQGEIISNPLTVQVVAAPPGVTHAVTNQWGPVTCGVQMSVRLYQNKTEITTNEAFELVVSMRNVLTNKHLSVIDAIPDDNDSVGSFSCIILSPSGKAVFPKGGRKAGGSAANVELPPMQTVEIKYELGWIRKLVEVGDYTIILKKRLHPLFTPDCQEEIVSNPLKIHVIAAPEEGEPPVTNPWPTRVTQ